MNAERTLAKIRTLAEARVNDTYEALYDRLAEICEVLDEEES